jgi:hypothetical protein
MFQLPAEARLRVWREFRNQLNQLPLSTALEQVVQFWSRAPFTPYYLELNQPDTWPDPWTLIEENYYCDIAKCLGIMYTVSLTQHKTNLELEFRSYQDELGHEFNLAWIDDGKYILNLIDNKVVNIEQFDKTLNLKCRYSEIELKLNSY